MQVQTGRQWVYGRWKRSRYFYRICMSCSLSNTPVPSIMSGVRVQLAKPAALLTKLLNRSRPTSAGSPFASNLSACDAAVPFFSLFFFFNSWALLFVSIALRTPSPISSQF
ncbi:hypothetical protein EDD21DRAFT_378501 [Dissophora ornata]|nr:hypothetical protein EDD21DRAFT_378501 [Dissophora ornata]